MILQVLSDCLWWLIITVCYAWKNNILFYTDIWFFLYCLVQTCNSFHKFITIKKMKDCFVLLIQYFKENVQIFIQVSKFQNWCKMVLVWSRIYTRYQLFLIFPVCVTFELLPSLSVLRLSIVCRKLSPENILLWNHWTTFGWDGLLVVPFKKKGNITKIIIL